jgi:hypothetical protein
MAEPEYDVIIVGAGHNGLVAASYLARDGLSVLVLERLERIGGAIATEELYAGFHVPYCAYICHMLHGKIIDDLELRRPGSTSTRWTPVVPPVSRRQPPARLARAAKFAREIGGSPSTTPRLPGRLGAVLGPRLRHHLPLLPRRPAHVRPGRPDAHGERRRGVWETMLTSACGTWSRRPSRTHGSGLLRQRPGRRDPAAGSIAPSPTSGADPRQAREPRHPEGRDGEGGRGDGGRGPARGVEIRTGVAVTRCSWRVARPGRALADGRSCAPPS